MLEVLDIGNTFTRIATWNGGVFVDLRRLPTGELPVGKGEFHRIAACVCPEEKERLKDSGIEFISALNQASKVDFSLVDCSTLGGDRVANAIAAAELYSLPAAVIDCGTAITLEVVDERCRFAGGAIAPGRKLLRKALASGTAQLPEIAVDNRIPENIGCNTVDAIRFGVDAGAVGVVREWLSVLQKKYSDLTVILTGGDAAFFAPAFPEAIIADEYFTLNGIRLAGKNS
ncbi:MAG: type III pantothenate kinase [Lentisphaeria bacterium]|nr:type III pantothenate kinase [Lentisphaeria bacterium]